MVEGLQDMAVLRWAAIAVAVVVIVWLVWPRAEPQSSEETPPSAPPSAPAPRARQPVQRPDPLQLRAPASSPEPVEAGLVQPAPAEPPPARQPPVSALRAAFEREVPDSTAAQAEQRIRAIFQGQPHPEQVFRHALCTRSVCRIDLRWSPELSPAYNAGLKTVVEEFTKEISFEPDQALGGAQMPIPMNIYIARPGHTVESLLEEETAH